MLSPISSNVIFIFLSHEISPPLHQRRTLQMTRKENEGFGFVLQVRWIVLSIIFCQSYTSSTSAILIVWHCQLTQSLQSFDGRLVLINESWSNVSSFRLLCNMYFMYYFLFVFRLVLWSKLMLIVTLWLIYPMFQKMVLHI